MDIDGCIIIPLDYSSNICENFLQFLSSYLGDKAIGVVSLIELPRPNKKKVKYMVNLKTCYGLLLLGISLSLSLSLWFFIFG
jgi:hypothetical protein